MTNKEYDVVIVGGSFGGTVAGKVAAEKGLNTLIIERASVPGLATKNTYQSAPKLLTQHRLGMPKLF